MAQAKGATVVALHRVASLLSTRPRAKSATCDDQLAIVSRAAMIQHDLYHAGESNHIRALYQQNDL